jgi:hypothetical protein
VSYLGTNNAHENVSKSSGIAGQVAPACNPSYSGGRVQEDPGSKPTWANSFKTLSQKKKKSQKRAGRVAQGVGREFKPQYYQKKKISGRMI